MDKCELDFRLELRSEIWVIVWQSGGVRPASHEEIIMWNMLQEKGRSREMYTGKETCPNCGSEHVEQTAFDGDDGYNGFVCSECGTHFGN